MELLATNIQWHTSDELPEDSDKNAILIYNVKEDDYDISFYNKCPKGYLWCYFKDIIPPVIKKEYLEMNEKDFQEFLKTKL